MASLHSKTDIKGRCLAVTTLLPLDEANVLIVGVARNCEQTIVQNVSALRRAFVSAKSVSHYVVESDSDDGTVELLQTLKNTLSGFQFVSLGRLSDQYPKRTERLAYCRNEYQRYAREVTLDSRCDFVVVADLDGINAEITEDAVQSCWCRDDWDACFANQKGPYYDIWALRHSLWSPNDCWAQERFYRTFLKVKAWSTWLSVQSRQITIPPHSEWIAVESAYGGLGIYRSHLFLLDVGHVGLDDEGEEICDIPSLHQGMRLHGARLMINPALLNGGYNEHTRKQRWPHIVKHAIKLCWYQITFQRRYQ